jgi:hypothetical protein
MGLWKYNLITEHFVPLSASFIPNGVEMLNRAFHFNWFLGSILTSCYVQFFSSQYILNTTFQGLFLCSLSFLSSCLPFFLRVSHALNTEDSYECDDIQAGKTESREHIWCGLCLAWMGLKQEIVTICTDIK